MSVIVLLIVAAVAAGVLIANAVFSHEPRRRRRMPPDGGGAPPSAAPVPARPVGPRGSAGDEELPPFEVLAEHWDQEAPPYLPYPGERSASPPSDPRADDQADSGDGGDDSGGGDQRLNHP